MVKSLRSRDAANRRAFLSQEDFGRHPQVNAKRRQNNARNKGLTTIEPILPEADRAELEIYGKENQFVPAIALKIYQGNKLTHQMLPQHTQGWAMLLNIWNRKH